MTWVLGLSAFYHDSSVALLHDGEPIFAASEESFSRRKHDASFPTQALQAALRFANIGEQDLDYVGFYEKPLLKFERLLETYLAFAPRGYRQFATALPSWLQTKLHIPREIRRQLGSGFKKRIVFCEHHESHAASAFFPSPYEQAAILTVDGVGEWATTTWGIGDANNIHLHGELRFPHSLGLLYSAFTYFCGFRVNSGEYKLMGLAPLGIPRYYELIMEKLLTLCDDGSFRLNMRYFGYCVSLWMTNGKLERLLGFSRRQPDGELSQNYMDLAASVQKVAEEILLRMARFVHEKTGLDHLVLAGGVALNCVANGRLLRESPFTQIWVQPAAGDAGGALGVALLIWHQLMGKERLVRSQTDPLRSSCIGPACSDASELQTLRDNGAVAHHYPVDDELHERVAQLLAVGKVVGWVQDAMEFGPRALGRRSILADPRRADMQARLNATIKNRESFRPFAPAVLQQRASQYFAIEAGETSPFMLFTFQVLSGSSLPAVTHCDNSARIQTVNAGQQPRLHSLLEKFDRLTGCPALVNTSFNVRGEPMVRTASEAYRCFLATDMDALVIEDHLLLRAEQPMMALTHSQRYFNELEPD
jgi:carbamoyltransferase